MQIQPNPMVLVDRGTEADVVAWARLRAALWPDGSPQEHSDEIRASLEQCNDHSVGLVAKLENNELVGFAEASLRRDYVNGCSTSPVLFLEGIYVEPSHRRLGIGRALFEAVKAFGRSASCTEFASDALLDNVDSHAFHKALGFDETERVVYFHQAL